MEDPRIIDAHVHHWDLRRTPREASGFVKLLGWAPSFMNWLAPKIFPRDVGEFFGGPEEILADYLPERYRADTADRDVQGFVHIEAGWKGEGTLGPVEETRWLDAIESSRICAIVGYADLALGESVGAVLDAHLAASDRFRGVRYPLAHHPGKGVWSACEDAEVMRDARWREGYAQLAERGLSFDAAVYHHQLDAVCELARAVPDVALVVCHAGTPTAYGGPFGGEGQTEAERATVAERWRDSMRALAELPHVTVKISGLVMPILGWGYHLGATPSAADVAGDLQPMVDFLIDTFGADRCMFASNFPVDRISLRWSTLYDAFFACTAHRSRHERAALFHDTAARVYRIAPG